MRMTSRGDNGYDKTIAVRIKQAEPLTLRTTNALRPPVRGACMNAWVSERVKAGIKGLARMLEPSLRFCRKVGRRLS